VVVLRCATLAVALVPTLLWAQPVSSGRFDSGEVRFLRRNEQGFEEYLWLKDSSPMIGVGAGTFTMGSNDGDDDERPVHQVCMDRYLIDKYEVTNRQYKQFCDATGRSYPDDPGWPGMSAYFLSCPSCPVVNVSWEDAAAFCSWAGKRLPTEAEWENAARGTDLRKFPWGASSTLAHGNFAERSTYYGPGGYARTAAVGSFPGGASPCGCLDMAGNVWEWCNDRYQASYYAGCPRESPSGPSSGPLRVLRGGSWKSSVAETRCAYRSSSSPSGWCDDLGFRCAASVSGPSAGAKAAEDSVPAPPAQGSRAVSDWQSSVPFEEVEVKPRLLNLPMPTYPDMARTAGIEGQVEVELLVDVNGSVADARIVKPSGNFSLDKAGLDAALRAKFAPGREKRRPVRVRVCVPFRFALK
jgi:TonB family protein